MYRFFASIGEIEKYQQLTKLFEVIIFIRAIKLVTLLYEITVMRVILETLRNLFGPLRHLFAVTMTIFFEFTVFGSFMFGGLVTTDSPAIANDYNVPTYYTLVNFNDYVTSFVTLFILMVVNNWYVIVDMFVAVKDNILLYRLFFICFYYFGVVLAINIVVAFAIDMYSAVCRLDEQKTKNEKFLLELST